MARVFEFKISGLEQVQYKLEHLPIKASRKIMRRSLKEAGQIWLDEMKTRIRQGVHHFKDHTEEFGVIEKNIVMRVSSRSDVSGYVRVGVLEKSEDPRSPFWALFVEFGTAIRFRGRKSGGKRGGATTGQMPAFPFARPTFYTKKQAVVDKFVTDVKQALNEEGLKLE